MSIFVRLSLFVFLLLPFRLTAFDLGEKLRIDGFATLGASSVLEPGQEFRAYTFERDGVRLGEVNLQNNSLLELQGEARFTNTLSATVQGVLVNTRANVFEPKLDWAYLSYTAGTNLTLRAGRFRLPLFNSSELTYVGFARSWVRPALPFYGVAGLEHYNGVNLLYTLQYDSVQWGFEAGFGADREESINANGGKNHFHSDDMFIARITAEGNHYHFGMTYFRADTDLELNFGPQPVETTTLTQLLSAETELYLDALTVQAGLGYGRTEETLPNELLAYAGASYQIEAWRPYLLYSDKTFDHKKSGQTPPAGAPPRPGYVSEQSFSLGLRYDLTLYSDLKFQVDRILGMQYNPQLLISDDADKREATVMTLAIDVVF